MSQERTWRFLIKSKFIECNGLISNTDNIYLTFFISQTNQAVFTWSSDKPFNIYHRPFNTLCWKFLISQEKCIYWAYQFELQRRIRFLNWNYFNRVFIYAVKGSRKIMESKPNERYTPVISVHYPGVVKNVSNMLETLGGIRTISSASFVSVDPTFFNVRCFL